MVNRDKEKVRVHMNVVLRSGFIVTSVSWSAKVLISLGSSSTAAFD